jgi:hypothetical protein
VAYPLWVLQGKALAALGRTDDSVRAYRTATAAMPAEPLAWLVRPRACAGPRARAACLTQGPAARATGAVQRVRQDWHS